MWDSPPIRDARLTAVPEALVTLWAVIAANRARQERGRLTRRGLLVTSPLAALALAGLWLLWAGWVPQ